MTLQRILGAAALTLIITGAYAATSDPGDAARARSPATPSTASAPAVANASTTADTGG
ncbi:MAG: hypothetical protein JWP35_3305 [Caulobacter sp.]|nr:hypothetical protein [Caulobacter sp.]